MTAILKIGNYGIYLFANEYDAYRDTAHNWGYKIWWNSTTPRIEESVRFSRWGEHAQFSWELFKNGKQFDGLTVQGPLIKFSGGPNAGT